VVLAKNCTETMVPSVSLARAAIEIGLPTGTEVFVTGVVMDTVGGWPITVVVPVVPPVSTVTLTGCDKNETPRLSTASAVRSVGVLSDLGTGTKLVE